MQKANEIREHISAIEQTRKITGAMEMISSNRMRQVMSHIEHNRTYFTHIRRSMKEILTTVKDISHPFLHARDRQRLTYVVISGDKGFCGAHNSTVLNFALERIRENPDSGLITLGQTAVPFFKAHGITPTESMTGIVQDPTVSRAREVVRTLTKMYEEEETDEIRVIYTSFYGETKRKPVEARLLPLFVHDYGDIRDAQELEGIIYHPSAQKVFDYMVPQFIFGLFFGIMVQAYASEHYSRMTAMRSATTNAKDMIDKLNTQFNLARQSAITNELAETADAAEILKGTQDYEQPEYDGEYYSEYQ